MNPDSTVMTKNLLYQFEQGFLTEAQIRTVTGFQPTELAKLIEDGYLNARKSYFDDLTLYFPTRKAHQYLKEQNIKVYVQCLKRPPAKNELHDRRLTDIRILFEQMGYPEWQSEKCLHQRGMSKVRPDAILSLGRRKVAIELEMSGKGSKQYEKRFHFYADHPAIDGVLYIVATPEQRKRLHELARGYRKIYFVLLRNLTEYRQNAYVERSGFPGAVQLWKFFEAIKCYKQGGSHIWNK